MRAGVRWLAVASALGAVAAMWWAALPAAAQSIRPIGQVQASGHATIPKNGILARSLVPPALPSTAGERPYVPKLHNGQLAVNRPGLSNITALAPLAAATPLQKMGKAGGPSIGFPNIFFEGGNHFYQRWFSDFFANTQFSEEPPDGGLCVGDGLVVQFLNSFVAVFDASDGDLLGLNNLNAFFGYAPEIIRPSGPFGPFITDPQCVYDPVNDRFYMDVLTLDVNPSTGDFTGDTHLDIAVSDVGDPFTWSTFAPGIYTTDDGTNGTPVHANCPCFGDYPHIGMDANGVFISTNEYSLFGSGYNGAEIYALSKVALSVPFLFGQMIENATLQVGRRLSPGFTVWPANYPQGASNADPEYGGTEWFVSSLAGDGSETGNFTGGAALLATWAARNTSSLNTIFPNLSFSATVIRSEPYRLPPKARQAPGDIPLGDSIPEPEGQAIDTNDTRIQQPWYCCGLSGKLYSSLDTAVRGAGGLRAGIAWFVEKPSINPATLTARATMSGQGYLSGGFNTDLSYPAIAVNQNGDGMMSFSMMGNAWYPTAAYVGFNSGGPNSSIIFYDAGNAFPGGADANDGFTNYAAFVGSPPRIRWGDYNATVVDPSSGDVWGADEMIFIACDDAEYAATSGICDDSNVFPHLRSALANWSTLIFGVTP
jgi:hypothetical protein